jgi:SAM-dependent methyltransferase
MTPTDRATAMPRRSYLSRRAEHRPESSARTIVPSRNQTPIAKIPFADHFSSVAAQYANSRPRYPQALFATLAERAPSLGLAWEAGCGSGQAAVGLAEHFATVIATDASAEQIAHAEPRSNLRYAVAGETNPALADGSVDLVTAAQALHWFDRPAFYQEVARVLAPGGLLAVWAYELAEIDAAVDAVVLPWYRDTLAADWPPERQLIENHYRTIGFPYAPQDVPPLAMQVSWSRDQLLAYLGTWSAVKRYRERVGSDPIDLVLPGLVSAWPHNEPRVVRWPLVLLVGGPHG